MSRTAKPKDADAPFRRFLARYDQLGGDRFIHTEDWIRGQFETGRGPAEVVHMSHTIIGRVAYDNLVRAVREAAALALEVDATRWEESSGQISSGVYVDPTRGIAYAALLRRHAIATRAGIVTAGGAQS